MESSRLRPSSTGQTPAKPTGDSSPFISLAQLEVDGKEGSPASSSRSPMTPNTRVRTYSWLLEALETHPRFNEILESAASAGSPTRRGWRKHARRAFYVLVSITLIAIGIRLHSLATALESNLQQGESVRQQAESIAALVRSESASGALMTRTAAERRALQTSVAINVGLIVINCVLAVRGVKIWHLLQRVGFEGWVHTIAIHLPWTRRVSRVWGWATLPVRKVLTPVRLLTPGGWSAIRSAQREAALKAAAEAARQAAAARAANLPWRIAYRNAIGAATFVDHKVLGGLGSFVNRHAYGAATLVDQRLLGGLGGLVKRTIFPGGGGG